MPTLMGFYLPITPQCISPQGLPLLRSCLAGKSACILYPVLGSRKAVLPDKSNDSADYMDSCEGDDGEEAEQICAWIKLVNDQIDLTLFG